VSADPIETAATALGPLLNDVVFLGGASIHLWLSDPGAPDTRATEDVDVISDITSLTSYYKLGERLRARGFSEASDSRVICRWRHSETGLILDVMPHDEDVLGFSNPWYKHTIDTATTRRLPSGTTIRAATPPSIIATKLAAWHGRGNNDMLRSLDLHDILVLIDGRPELPAEVATQNPELRNYISRELTAIREHRYFDYLTESALHGHGRLAPLRAQHLQQHIDAIVSTSSPG
jgi:predicted nucleotidyltransferase